jgi:hypothetical protein
MNPNAWRRKPMTEEHVLASATIGHPLTQYMFCSPGEGAPGATPNAAVLVFKQRSCVRIRPI